MRPRVIAPSATFVGYLFAACLLSLPAARADILYGYDDGSSELGLGIDPGEDALNFNRFTVAPGGEIINSISVAYGRPGSTSILNGLPVSILLYEDVDGGSPFDAVLLRSISATVANANTNLLNDYPIPPTEVHGTFLAAFLFRNRTGTNRFIGAVDRTAPHVSDASFYGYTIGDMNEADLSSIPVTQRGTLESLNFPGNFLIRANGQPVPEPAAALVLVTLVPLTVRRGRRRQS
jgi:hypothetical protein